MENCLFMWHLFFEGLDNFRKKTSNGHLLPFAIAPGDGEAGFNIRSKYSKAHIVPSNEILGSK